MLYCGEERATRIVSKQHVQKNWNAEEKIFFGQYAYPLGGDVYAIWDEEPHQWSPQNHSCNANTQMRGLNMYAKRSIAPGEELTLDYAELLDREMEPFECKCGAPNCRGTITFGKQ